MYTASVGDSVPRCTPWTVRGEVYPGCGSAGAGESTVRVPYSSWRYTVPAPPLSASALLLAPLLLLCSSPLLFSSTRGMRLFSSSLLFSSARGMRTLRLVSSLLSLTRGLRRRRVASRTSGAVPKLLEAVCPVPHPIFISDDEEEMGS